MSLTKKEQKVIFYIKNRSFEDYLKKEGYGDYWHNPNYVMPIWNKMKILTPTFDSIIREYQHGDMLTRIIDIYNMLDFLDKSDEVSSEDKFYKSLISFIRAELDVRDDKGNYINGFTKDIEEFIDEYNLEVKNGVDYMRDATAEEMKSETGYIMSISSNTGIKFDDIK